MMQVVEAISDMNIGGAGVLLWLRLKNSDRSKIKSTVLLPKGSALRSRFTAIDIPVIEVDGCYDRSLDIRAIKDYRRVLKRLSPDLVNCHGCLSCRIAARQCHVPVSIYTRHCAYPPKRWQTSLLGRSLIGWEQCLLSDHVIAVAEAAKQNLMEIGVSSKQISVIINGVEGVRRLSQQEREEVRQKLNVPKEATVIGIFGRLEPCKGHTVFLESAEKLLASSDRFFFLIVGGGSREEELKRDSRCKGIDEHVRFVGFVEDIAPYMNISDIAVNCSVGTETSSLALSEAMSLGIPCVVSDYGGNPYMIKQGVNGLVYPTADATTLAAYLHRLSENKVLYEELSRNAYDRFYGELNAQNMTRQTEALYERLWKESDFGVKRRASHRRS